MTEKQNTIPQAPGQIPDPGQTPGPERTQGWMPNSLSWLTRGLRLASLGSPLVGAAGIGALGWWLGKKYGHKVQKLVSPKSFGGNPDLDPDYDTDEERKDRNNVWAWGLGILGPLAFLAANYQPGAWDKGLLTYNSMSKDASAYGHLTLDDSRALIMGNPELNDTQKMMSMGLLNTFNAPPTATISGPDLVGQAISTGYSAATGAAIGYLTANALGLPNPRSTAILGAVTNTLGVRPAMALSAIFGN